MGTETTKLTQKDGTIVYFLNVKGVMKMHNWEGPALIPQGNKKNAEYYLFGVKVTKDKWEASRKDIEGQPFYKTAAGKAAGSRV
jgi:hypothetical protein